MSAKKQKDRVKVFRTIYIDENNVVSVPSDEGAPQHALSRVLKTGVATIEEVTRNKGKKGIKGINSKKITLRRH